MKRISVFVWAAMMVTFVLSGCGGSSGGSSAPTTISGVAAAGAPIIGFAYLKDSHGTSKGPVTIAADGSFSFDVTGLTAPFYLQAQGAAGGQSYTLHSLAIGVGTANINPLTNLVVSQATGGQDPAVVFGDPTQVTTVNQASVDAAIAAIQTALAPLLAAANVSATVNPLTGSYTADASTNPLDALFDTVSIQVIAPATSGASSTVSITDKTGTPILNSTSITTFSSTASTVATSVSSGTTSSTVTQTISDNTGISTFLQSFAGTVTSKGVGLATSDLGQYYYGTDGTFGLNEGYSRTQTIQDLVTSLTGKIIPKLGTITKIGNFSILNDVTASVNTKNGTSFNKVYRILADFYFQDGSYGSPKGMTVVQVTAGGAWQFIGDGFLAYIEIHPYAIQTIPASGSVFYKTGMYIDLEDQGNQGVNSASLEGPGLPSGGITLSKAATGNASNTVLALDSQYEDYTTDGNSWAQYEMNDTQISKIFNGTDPSLGRSPYTLKFYSTTTAPNDRTTKLMQTIHPILHAGVPVTNAALASATTAATYFATASFTNFNQTLSGFLALLNANPSLPFTYTLPTAYNPSWLEASINLWDNSTDNSYTNLQLALNKTGASIIGLGLTFTPTSGFLEIRSEDSSHRLFDAITILR